MKILLVACALLFGLVTGHYRADAGIFSSVPLCCECQNVAPGAQTSAFVSPPTPALFCVDATDEESGALKMRCAERDPEAKLFCLQKVSGPTCSQQLRERFNVVCPGHGAPVTGAAGLAVLVAMMGIAGVLAIRRART